MAAPKADPVRAGSGEVYGAALRVDPPQRHPHSISDIEPVAALLDAASEFGRSLGQLAWAEKSNQIAAIPELLRLVDVAGAPIAIDAMGAQKAIAARTVD